MRKLCGMSLLFRLFILTCVCVSAIAAEKPNIVIILGDDIGYGDFGCYGATKVRTPAIDKLARQGLRFTDAHSASAVCTPSRYALIRVNMPGAIRRATTFAGERAIEHQAGDVDGSSAAEASRIHNGVHREMTLAWRTKRRIGISI